MWLSWADFLEYHAGQLAAAIADCYRTTLTYPPLDWDGFDVVLAVPGPNQEDASCAHKTLRVAWERLELGWAGRAAVMAVACTPTLELARAVGLDPVLLPWGINPAHFRPRPIPGGRETVVGWSGRYLNPRKRFAEVEAAFRDVPGLVFRPSKSEMLHGRQVGAYELPGIADDYYAHIDVLVCGSSYEGFAFPMLEAAAVGRAIVSFDVGIARDLKEDGAGVVIVEDFAEMRDAVRSADLEALGRRSAQAVAERWTWAALRERWLEALDGVGR